MPKFDLIEKITDEPPWIEKTFRACTKGWSVSKQGNWAAKRRLNPRHVFITPVGVNFLFVLGRDGWNRGLCGEEEEGDLMCSLRVNLRKY